MVVIEDFTKLQSGVRVPIDGQVVGCPRCGRNGVRRQRMDGSVRYVHVQTSELMGDGLRSEAADLCTITPAPGSPEPQVAGAIR
ncbi:MAG TPA: hypothetical protein VIA45_06825 [Thermoanaerobaculia bacterium]|jgi:hypothetical protein